MKKLFIFILAAFFGCSVHAQTTKGTVALTAAFGYNQYNGTADKEVNNLLFKSAGHNYTIAPSVGLFIRDNLELGASAYLHENTHESLAPSPDFIHSFKSESQEKAFKLYARQYKFLTQRLAAYATLSGGINSRNYSSTVTHTYLAATGYIYTQVRDDHYTTFSAALSPGLSFFASDKIAISMNLGALAYSRHKVDEASDYEDSRYTPNSYEAYYKSNILELDFSSINLNFGLTYFIRK